VVLLSSTSGTSAATNAPSFARADYPLFGNNYVAGDFNGDGSLDLAGVGTAAKVRLNNSAGAFGAVVEYAIGGQARTSRPATSMATEDSTSSSPSTTRKSGSRCSRATATARSARL
jgi:hypothetical protein